LPCGPPGEPGLLQQLDAFRGLSALLVLASHLAQVFWLPFVEADSALVPFFATLARHAVLVFFLLSGFFIALSMRRNAKANGRFDGLSSPWRALRALFPPLVGALLLTAACVAALGPAGVARWARRRGSRLDPEGRRG
jgi:peptidoglycan/LPS O-acetylase OafA/YrhL